MSLICSCLHSCAAACDWSADVCSLLPASLLACPVLTQPVLCAQLLQQEYKRATDDRTGLKSLVADLSSQRNSAKVCLNPEGTTLNV